MTNDTHDLTAAELDAISLVASRVETDVHFGPTMRAALREAGVDPTTAIDALLCAARRSLPVAGETEIGKLCEELERLGEEAFRAPWTYSRWEVECSACDGGADEPDGGCPNPDCDGSDASIVCVESPKEYPDGQIVAQISVPGLLSLADKNGELICALRNALPTLLAAARRAELAQRFLREHGETLKGCQMSYKLLVKIEALMKEFGLGK